MLIHPILLAHYDPQHVAIIRTTTTTTTGTRSSPQTTTPTRTNNTMTMIAQQELEQYTSVLETKWFIVCNNYNMIIRQRSCYMISRAHY